MESPSGNDGPGLASRLAGDETTPLVVLVPDSGKNAERIRAMSSAPGPDSIQYRTRNRGMLLRVDSLIVRPSRQEELLFSSADAWVEFFETLPNDQ